LNYFSTLRPGCGAYIYLRVYEGESAFVITKHPNYTKLYTIFNFFKVIPETIAALS